MCYHYSLGQPQEAISKVLSAEWEMPFEPIYHISGFAFAPMPVITQQEPHKVQAYQWGLIPHWVKTTAEAQKLKAQTLNAKAETLFEKPAFRTYVMHNRCLVLSDGFFEWMEYKKKKYPHFVHLKNNELFAFAGLYSHWTDKETGELLHTFTIITTDANPLMARIHNTKQRMPVILPKEQWQHWLEPSLNKEQIESMLFPCDDKGMKAYSISKLITTRGAETNVPQIKEPYQYSELASTEEGTLFDTLG